MGLVSLAVFRLPASVSAAALASAASVTWIVPTAATQSFWSVAIPTA
jgi:hypothetical protein